MGYLLAFLAAGLESGKDMLSKIALDDEIDEYVTSWALRFFALAVLWPILFFIEIPELNRQFWFALFASGALNVAATILFMKAIQYEDLSLTIPMISFTPLFLLVTSPLIIGEIPSIIGLAGVILITIGAYVLNIHKHDHKNYLAPIKSIFKDRGTRLMLLVAFIWSFTSIFDKMGINNSSALFWVVVIHIFLTVTIFPIMWYKNPNFLQVFKNKTKKLAPFGVLNALKLSLQHIALSLALVPYVVSIKRMSILFSVLIGYFFFKDSHIKKRLIGAGIMLTGAVFIILFA